MRLFPCLFLCVPAMVASVSCTDNGKTSEPEPEPKPKHNFLGYAGFVTTRTWAVGDQVWSDAVTATRCKKDEYDGGIWYEGSPEPDALLPDCRQNPGYGDLFSWKTVELYKSVLCADGWRVPTVVDFIALDNAMGGDGSNVQIFDPAYTIVEDGYMNSDVWGGTLGGMCNIIQPDPFDIEARYPVLEKQGVTGYYWTQDNNDMGGTLAWAKGVALNPAMVYLDFRYEKEFGYQVRCVRDRRDDEPAGYTHPKYINE